MPPVGAQLVARRGVAALGGRAAELVVERAGGRGGGARGRDVRAQRVLDRGHASSSAAARRGPARRRARRAASSSGSSSSPPSIARTRRRAQQRRLGAGRVQPRGDHRAAGGLGRERPRVRVRVDRHPEPLLQAGRALGELRVLARLERQDDHVQAPAQLVAVVPAQSLAHGLRGERERAGGVGEERDVERPRRLRLLSQPGGAPVMKGVMPSDEDLLAATRRDPRAFGEFYARHERAVFRYFYRRTGDVEVAADLSAECFAAALIVCERFRPGGAPAVAWLFGIARNILGRSAERRRVESRARAKLGMPALDPGGRHARRARAHPRRAAARERARLPSRRPGRGGPGADRRRARLRRHRARAADVRGGRAQARLARAGNAAPPRGGPGMTDLPELQHLLIDAADRRTRRRRRRSAGARFAVLAAAAVVAVVLLGRADDPDVEIPATPPATSRTPTPEPTVAAGAVESAYGVFRRPAIAADKLRMKGPQGPRRRGAPAGRADPRGAVVPELRRRAHVPGEREHPAPSRRRLRLWPGEHLPGRPPADRVLLGRKGTEHHHLRVPRRRARGPPHAREPRLAHLPGHQQHLLAPGPGAARAARVDGARRHRAAQRLPRRAGVPGPGLLPRADPRRRGARRLPGSRLLVQTADTRAWLVPRLGAVCLVVRSGGARAAAAATRSPTSAARS